MYKFLDHTSDILMEVKSETIEGIFREAVKGMFSYLLPNGGVSGKISVRKNIKLKSVSFGTLLADFLNEFIYYFFAKRLFPVKIEITQMSEFFLECSAVFCRVGKRVFGNALEIKSAAYHGAEISKNKNFKARVIFDV
ncbi:MAG: archease [Elusimicrobia bacterium]|nr:archease [Elusimicrobiota bacterium]